MFMCLNAHHHGVRVSYLCSTISAWTSADIRGPIRVTSQLFGVMLKLPLALPCHDYSLKRSLIYCREGKKNCVWVSLLELQLGKCSANFSPIWIRRIPFSLIMQKWEQYSSTNRTRKSVQGVLSSNLFSYHLVTHWCFVMHPPPLPLICKVPFDLLCRVLSQGNM